MKHCNRSFQCPYGNVFEKNVCAYDTNLHEYDLCPYFLENWDAIMDEIDKIRKGDDNHVE